MSSKGKGGRPAYAPTAKEREQVKELAGMGVPQVDIARVMGMTAPTLRKHFRDELDHGMILANASVAQSLFRQATDPDKPSTVAAIFWLKSRAGWIEADKALQQVGKKEQRQADAEEVVKTRFAPSAPPKLVVDNKR